MAGKSPKRKLDDGDLAVSSLAAGPPSFPWFHAINEHSQLVNRDQMSVEQIRRAQENYEENDRLKLITPNFHIPYCGPGREWLPAKRNARSEQLRSQFMAEASSTASNAPVYNRASKSVVYEDGVHAAVGSAQGTEPVRATTNLVWFKHAPAGKKLQVTTKPSSTATSTTQLGLSKRPADSILCHASEMPKANKDDTEGEVAQLLGHDQASVSCGTGSLASKAWQHSKPDGQLGCAVRPVATCEVSANGHLDEPAHHTPQESASHESPRSPPCADSAAHKLGSTATDTGSEPSGVPASKRDDRDAHQPRRSLLNVKKCFVCKDLMQLASPRVMGEHGFFFASAVCLNQIRAKPGLATKRTGLIWPTSLAKAVGARHAFFGAISPDINQGATAQILRNENLMCVNQRTGLRGLLAQDDNCKEAYSEVLNKCSVTYLMSADVQMLADASNCCIQIENSDQAVLLHMCPAARPRACKTIGRMAAIAGSGNAIESWQVLESMSVPILVQPNTVQPECSVVFVSLMEQDIIMPGCRKP